MKESRDSESVEQESPAERETESPGKLLTKSRQSQGLSVSDVARELRLKENIILSLEGDRYEELPGRTYSRGYLSSYAKLLGESPSRIIALFDSSSEQSSPNPPISKAEILSLKQAPPSAILWLIPLLIVIACAGFWAWYNKENFGSTLDQAAAQQPNNQKTISNEGYSNRNAQTPSPALLPPATGQPAVPETQGTLGEEPSFPPANPEELRQETSPPIDGLAPINPNLKPGDKSVISAEEPIYVNTDSGDLTANAGLENPSTAEDSGVGPGTEFKFEFSKKCWAEVQDADGVRHLYDLYQAGTSKTIIAHPPLRVTLGDATGVTIYRNGRPFALPGDNKIYGLTID